MTIKKRTQITVSLRWKDRRGQPYATLRWREPTPHGTQRKEKALGYLTEEEAEEARAELEATLRLDLERDDSPGLSVAELLVAFLDQVEASPTSKSHKDRTSGDCINLVRHLGRLRAEALTSHHVGRYLALRSKEKVLRVRRRNTETDAQWERRANASRTDPDGRPVSSTTIRAEVATLRRAMRWGQDAGMLRAEPVSLPGRGALPKDKRPARRLTEAEVRQLIAAAPEEYTELMTVLAWSGRRPKAIFHLRVQDCARLVDMALPRGQRLAYWQADKGGESRGWGPVTEPAYRAILDRLEALGDAPGSRLLWTAPAGGPLVSTTWPKTFNRIAELAGVSDVRTYDLRKHACAQILRHLGNPHEAILYSGHKTVEVFVRNYAYALEGNAEEAAARIGWTPAPLRAVEDK